MRKGGRAMEARRLNGSSTLSDSTLGYIFSHLDNPADRSAVSRVCRQWKFVDSNTRKHVQISNCYSVAPAALSRRFPKLKSLKIKGQPRAIEFGLLPDNWGGYAAPWVAEVARAYADSFEGLWLRRMEVTDEDLLLLARSCPNSLLTLKLEKCTGFSTVGLAYITANCRSLKVLCLDECNLLESSESNMDWLHQLAVNNPNLEELNFQHTSGLDNIDGNDLEAIAENCLSLRSLKVCEDVDVLVMERVASRSTSLIELGTGNCAKLGGPDRESSPTTITFPRSIVALNGLYELTDSAVPMISSMLANLRRLELQYTLLSREGHCQILQHCVNLEALWTRNGLGDEGLRLIGRTCRKLRRIRVEDSEGEGFLSPEGIIPLVEGCVKLEFLVMYCADLNNEAMAAIGRNCTVLKDCRFVITQTLPVIRGFPLDEGVKAILIGCQNLTRFALYVRRGALTDKGMGYIGDYGAKLKWVLLGCTGDSDLGLTRLARGCQSLEKLELRDCPVTELGLVAASVAMQNCLKFLWTQTSGVTETRGRILARARPNWTVEIAPELETITSYYSLAEPRTDHPPDVFVFQSRDGQPNVLAIDDALAPRNTGLSAQPHAA